MSNTALVNNVYYTVAQYIDPILYTTPQRALVDEKLLFPLVNNAGNYQIGLQKAKIPLDTIPLTPYNIPLKRYELTLRQGSLEASAYVRQVGASSLNYVWNCDANGLVSQYSYSKTSGALSLITQSDISSIVPYVSYFVVDDFVNAYVAGSQTQGGVVNTLYIINLASLTILGNLSFSQIQGLDIDRGQKLYVADEAPSGSVVKIYSNSNSATEVILTEIFTITEGFDGNTLTNIITLCADTNLLIGYETNKFSIYDTTNFQAIQGFTDASIKSLGQASSIISAGTGNFCITDDGKVRNLFVGSKANNIQNDMITNTEYSTGVGWLPSAKFAFTNAYMFGIASDTTTYAQQYNPVNGALIGGVFQANATTGFASCATYPDRNQISASSSSRQLWYWNISGDANQWYLGDSQFEIGASVPLSWDYQNSTNKIVGIDSATNSLHITSQPIYPKNFIVGSNLNPNSTIATLYRGASAWNLAGTSQSVWTPNGTFNSGFSGSFYDQVSISAGSVLYYAKKLGNTDWIYKISSATGAVVSSYQLPNSTGGAGRYWGICRPYAGFYAMLDGNGTLTIRNDTTNAITQTIANACGTINYPIQFCYISGGQNSNNGKKCIFITNGTGLYVYTATATDGTGYALSFSTTNFVPDGYDAPMWLYQSVFYGAFFQGVPILFILTSGSTATPNNTSANTLIQVVFTDEEYTAIDFTGTSDVLDNINGAVINANSPMDYNINYGEIYMMNATQNSWNGTVTVFQVSTDLITGSFTAVSDTELANATLSFTNVILNGTSNYYTWSPITATGASNFISVAVGKTNPNEVYVLDNTYNVWRGILTGSNITFTSYEPPILATSGGYRSISLTPDTVSYDSTVYSYTISNQKAVGSKYYGNIRIPSIARDDVASQFIVSKINLGYDIFTSSTFAFVASSTLPDAFLNFAKNGEDVDAGYRNINSFQVLIDALNASFAEAYKRLKSAGGTLAEAPTISLSPSSGLWTLSYSSDYDTLGNGILFNQPLLQIVRFSSSPDTIDVGFYLLNLPPASTSLTQISKSAYLFNKLDKILFQSNTIFVSGSFVGNNSQNQIITDVDVPTEGYLDNTGQQLIYSPNFLRVFQLASNNAIDRVELNLLYSLVDGSQYQLTINPDQGWSVLLDFVRKF